MTAMTNAAMAIIRVSMRVDATPEPGAYAGAEI